MDIDIYFIYRIKQIRIPENPRQIYNSLPHFLLKYNIETLSMLNLCNILFLICTRQYI